jgi:hypothetical protein
MLSKFSVTGVPLVVIATCPEALGAKNAGNINAQSSAKNLKKDCFEELVFMAVEIEGRRFQKSHRLGEVPTQNCHNSETWHLAINQEHTCTRCVCEGLVPRG